jgi:hypothetical protein
VLFRNNTMLTLTMHPHGLQYEKNAEGALYEDGTSGADRKDDGVPPGGTYTYRWTVPERSGPGPHDPSSVVWMYHSHFYEPRDVNTGLIGPIIVTRKGWARPDGTPKDVDREFVTDFAIFDETESWYFEANMRGQRDYSPGLGVIDPVFRSRNLYYSINGFIEGNLPTPTMKRGERVRWYLLANSNEDDVHTPHWHGGTALVNNMRTDTVSLTPMSMVVADMVPEDVGTWLFHCHVNEHLQRGMVARYTVLPEDRALEADDDRPPGESSGDRAQQARQQSLPHLGRTYSRTPKDAFPRVQAPGNPGKDQQGAHDLSQSQGQQR